MTATGGNAKQKPFDLDAIGAARREAEGQGFVFSFTGETFTCLPSKEWPLSVSTRLTEGDLVGALNGILGVDQAEVFLAGNPTMGDVEALMTAVAKDAGVGGLGE